MPSDDLILNVRQITGYPSATSAIASDAVLVQRGGLGGPYMSIDAADFVGTALAQGGDMAIGGQLSVQSVQGGSAQFSNGAFGLLNAQKACLANLVATWGSIDTLDATVASFVQAQIASLGVSGDMQVGGVANMASAVVQTNLTVGGLCALGYLSVNQTLDAANLNISNLANVCNLTVNGNFAVPNGTATVNGHPIVTIDNAILVGLAPLDSPAFTGTPTAPTPAIGPTPPTDNSTAIATTAFVVGVVNQLGAQSSATFAPINSPNFSGLPTGPTAAPGNSTAQLATTAFVQAAVIAATAGVSSFNTRTGAVVLTLNDITSVGGATLVSPVFTGSPQAPTPPSGNNSGLLATTAFVAAAVSDAGSGYAPLDSPAFIGFPSAPTATTGNASGLLATTQFVQNTITAIDAGVLTFNGRSGNVTLTNNDLTAAGGAVLDSPAFVGLPTAPNAAPGVSTNQIATTAFVAAAVAAGGGVSSFNGRTGTVTLTLADVTGVGGASAAQVAANYLPLAGGNVSGVINLGVASLVAGATPSLNALEITQPLLGHHAFNLTNILSPPGWNYTAAGTGAVLYMSGGAFTCAMAVSGAAGAAATLQQSFYYTPGGGRPGGGVLNVNGAVGAFIAGSKGAFVGSQNSDVNLGFWSQSDTLYLGDADGLGNTSNIRASFSANGSMTLPSALTVNGTGVGAGVPAITVSGGQIRCVGYPIIAATSVTNGPFIGSLAGASGTNFGIVNSGGGLFFAQADGSGVLLGTWAQFRSTDSAFILSPGVGYMPGGGPWFNASDERIKKNVADYSAGLEEVCALRPISYQYNGRGGLKNDGKTYHGLVAQEAQPIMPEMVHVMGSEDMPDMLGMNTAALTFALVNAVRTLRDRITQLETRMAT
jgi:hypothetical protein